MTPFPPNELRDAYKYRLLSKVKKEPDTGCWIWIGGKSKRGRPIMWYAGKQVYAYRVSAWLWLGFTGREKGLQINHGPCDNPLCVHPLHIYIGTQKENVNDMFNRQRWARREPENANR